MNISKEDIALYNKIRRHITYSYKDGLFRWKEPIRTSRRPCKEGNIVSFIKNRRGYIRIHIFGKRFRAHRLAWFYTHGYWPKQLDHKDGDRSNNRVSNLRECGSKQNNGNSKAKRKNNGLPIGVYKQGNKFRSCISKNEKTIHLGSFESPEEAHKEYKKNHVKIHGEFSPYKNEFPLSKFINKLTANLPD